MFLHNYIYRLKCIVRDRQMMFWTLLFPIILATLFNMTLSNITSGEKFTKIKIAVINNSEYESNTAFKTAIKSVSNDAKDDSLFEVEYTSKEEGDKLLEDNIIKGYIYFDNGIKLIVKESGISQTIIKSFLDDFNQTSSTMETIIKNDPNIIQNGSLENVADRTDYLKEVPVGKSSPDFISHYFYTLIAMACLYGGFWGLKEVVAIQANLSQKAARVNMAPTHKMKVFLISILAATTVQLLEIFVLIAYLALVLNISFGGQLGFILLTCVIGTITGVTFGAFIASIVKGGEGVKIGILIGGSMTMSFLAGMMYDKMKYIISTKVPILSYLNPANLISDSFYSLYYYDSYNRFFTNIIILCGISLFFSLCTYITIRRMKYASL